MKKVLIPAIFAMLLAGCAQPVVTANMTPAQAQAAQAQAAANNLAHQYQLCVIYHGAHAQIVNKLTTLPKASANTLYAATQQATNLCTTVMSNNAQAAAQLTQAFVTIGTMAGINQLLN